MSQRERPAPRGRHPGDPPVGRPGIPVAWDDLYDRLPPGPRARLIAAAGESGVVPADQVPPAEPTRHLLHRLLAGDGVDDLAPLDVAVAIDDLPADLDPRQRAAVALSLRTPDVAVLQGLPGTGKSRVAAEVVALAARRGERVLLVAPDPAALDRVLELLADRPEVCPLRCVDKDETELPPAAAGCTFAAHTKRLTEQARERAAVRVEAAIATCRRRDAEAAVYDHLFDLAEQHQRLRTRGAELKDPAAVGKQHAGLSNDVAARRAEVERARQVTRDLEPVVSALRADAAARSAGRWWTPAWWRAGGDAAARLAEAEAKLRQAAADAAATEQEVARLSASLDRRRAELADESVAVDRELVVVADKWQQAVRQLPADGPRPDHLSPDAASAARDAWALHRDADRRDLDAARGWVDGLEPLLEALPGRLLEAVNLVAATPAALTADPHFGAGRRGLFDLLLVEEAHAVSDADLLAAAKRARRWFLVGEPEPAGRGERRGVSPTNLGSSQTKARRPDGATLAPSGFARLWDLLHSDPWARDGDRFVCRRRLVSATARMRLEREPVADRPDVELRILSLPGGEPELAEVAFPAGTPAPRAVEYLFQQLGEVPAAADPCWEDSTEKLVARWRAGAGGATAELGDGIRAAVSDAGVTAVEFDRTAGWDRERAIAWVRRHAGRFGPGRAVALETPHRMAPGLAEVVGELLGGTYAGPSSNGASPCVEFVPVPAMNGRNGPPAGAGLETNLADGRDRGRLPPDVGELPATGLVNVSEARAVVRIVGQLAADAGPVAVLALTVAQADLIRRLLRSTPGPIGNVIVSTPAEFRQREAGTVVVSLVRSHSHRAVPFGDEPDWLPQALARGRRRLVLVGDPGTLARRADWDGPLDHLDGPAARRERDLVRQIVRYLHGRGRFGRAFRVCPGSPP